MLLVAGLYLHANQLLALGLLPHRWQQLQEALGEWLHIGAQAPDDRFQNMEDLHVQSSSALTAAWGTSA